MKLNQHIFHFAQKHFERNYTLIIPFEIEAQTSSLKIEKFCLQNFKDIITFHELSIEELYKLQKMKSYIRHNLTNGDMIDIVNVFKSKGWFSYLPTENKKIFQIMIDDIKCTMSSDVYPFIRFYGKISINIKELINLYISTNKIVPKQSENKFVKEVIDIQFLQPLPYILMYERSHDIQQAVLSIIMELCNSRSSLSSSIAKAIGIENVYKFKKSGMWLNDTTVRVTVNDFMGLLTAKTKKNWVPLTFAGVMAYQHQQEKKKKILANQINIFEKILQTTKDIEK